MLPTQRHGLTTKPDTSPLAPWRPAPRVCNRRGLACVAMLALGMPVAQAEGVLEVVRAEGRLATGVVARLAVMDAYIPETTTGPTPMTSGQALGHELHADWDRETEYEGNWHETTGSFALVQSQDYVLESLSPTSTHLSLSGQGSFAGEWRYHDLANVGFPIGFPNVWLWNEARTSFTLELDQPVGLRLSGRTWSANQVVSGAMTLRFAASPGVPFRTLGEWNTEALSDGLESQWQLESGWLLFDFRLETGDFVPCCNTFFSSDSGWDFVLEASTPAAVPEPASAALLLAGIAALRWRRIAGSAREQ